MSANPKLLNKNLPLTLAGVDFAGDFPALFFPLVTFGVAAFGDFAGDLPLCPAVFFAGVACFGAAVTGIDSFSGLFTFLGETSFAGDFAAFCVTFFAGPTAFGVLTFIPLRVVLAFGVAAAGDGTDGFSGEATFVGCFPLRPTFLTGVVVFGVAAFLPLRVVFAFGVATTGDSAASFTGLSIFFGEAAFLPPFLTGVAVFGVATFLPLRVVFAFGVATTGDGAASLTGLFCFFGEAAFLPPFLTGVAAFGVAAFFPLRVAFGFGDATGVGADSFTGLSTFAFLAGETALTGVLAPRFPRVTFFTGVAGFGVAAFLPLRTRVTGDWADSFTGLSTFAFLGGEAAFAGDFPRLPRVAFGVAVFAGVATFGCPLVALPLPFAGVAAFGVAAFGFPLVDRPFVVLTGVADFFTTGAATGDSGLGVSTFGFPRVDRPFAFGVAAFLTGDAFLGFPLERDATAFGGDSTSAGGDATFTGEAVFFPCPLRPFGVAGLAGDDTTFLPLVALP